MWYHETNFFLNFFYNFSPSIYEKTFTRDFLGFFFSRYGKIFEKSNMIFILQIISVQFQYTIKNTFGMPLLMKIYSIKVCLLKKKFHRFP